VSRRIVVAGIVVVVAAIAASLAAAAVSISRAELNGTQLRIEGTALANRTVTVDGVALGASDANGNFKIEKGPYPPPADCIVDVDDGSGTPTPAFLSGCTQAAPPPAPGATGTIAIIPGGNGRGTITSTPAGISCTVAATGVTGPCQAFFPAGTVVRLDARPAADSRFLGWRRLPGCFDPQKITVVADTTIACQPAFQLRF
jgi:hypothetical protein